MDNLRVKIIFVSLYVVYILLETKRLSHQLSILDKPNFINELIWRDININITITLIFKQTNPPWLKSYQHRFHFPITRSPKFSGIVPNLALEIGRLRNALIRDRQQRPIFIYHLYILLEDLVNKFILLFLSFWFAFSIIVFD